VSPGAIVAGIGAILMLIALAVPWFTVRNGGSVNISAGDLLDTLSEQGSGEPLWAGMALPIILIIIAASIVLISVIYSVLARVTTQPLWRLMGTLAFFCVLGNAGYFLWWFHDNTLRFYGVGTWPNIAAAGSVLALVGAIIVMSSGMFVRRRTRQ
jgi:hypothetical protein